MASSKLVSEEAITSITFTIGIIRAFNGEINNLKYSVTKVIPLLPYTFRRNISPSVQKKTEKSNFAKSIIKAG
jgi:hypothetical protein